MTLRNYHRRQWQRNRCCHQKTYVNFLTKQISRSIREFSNSVFNKKLESFSTRSKQFWKSTKRTKNQCKIIPPLKIANNEFLFSDTDKANEIGQTFFQAHHITFSNKSDSGTESFANYTNFIKFVNPIVEEINAPKFKELIKILKNLKSKKSPGGDKISNLVIKQLPKKAVMMILLIVRACYFPATCKHAKIVCIHKPGKGTRLATSYRPINFLSSFSKILEKLILCRLNKIISSKNFLPNEQFGFRASHSTNHQLLGVSKFVRQNLDNKNLWG